MLLPAWHLGSTPRTAACQGHLLAGTLLLQVLLISCPRGASPDILRAVRAAMDECGLAGCVLRRWQHRQHSPGHPLPPPFCLQHWDS